MKSRRVFLTAVAVLAALPAAAQSARPYAIVGTNQTQCYDDRGRPGCPEPGQAFDGQDARHPGAAPHYRDNGDGTVSDLVTGLMWQKGFQQVAWADAPADAARARTGGHADWRVPTIKELYSLILFSGATGSMRGGFSSGPPADARPYLDTAAFDFEYPTRLRFIDAQYVSSTAYLGTTMGRDRAFFGVNFADGRIKAYPQDGGPGRRTWYARYVRGNPAYGRNAFAANADDTVTDRATGLMWTRGDSGDPAFAGRMAATRQRDGRLDWGEALKFCRTLTFAGRSDWRLPNAKELHSLVDYSRSPDATGSAAIDPLFRISIIKDPEGKPDWPYAWTSTSHLDGRGPGDFAVYIAFGRAQGHVGRGGGGGPPPGGGGGFGGPPPGGPFGGPPPGSFGGPPPGGPFGGPPGGMAMGGSGGALTLLDVHGAGAQRSSPKSGDESRLPVGAGPQGDVLRIYNSARCVADAR